jgi:hypothetical protein
MPTSREHGRRESQRSRGRSVELEAPRRTVRAWLAALDRLERESAGRSAM